MTPPWTLWPGGPCPVPAAQLVDYRMRCGVTLATGSAASTLRWEHTGGGGDILAYRIHEALDKSVK